TAQEAQPIAFAGDVITFGVPQNLLAAARPRFKKEADNIRSALTARLGRPLKFLLEPVAGFGDLAPASGPGGAEPIDDEDDVVDLAELADVGPEDAAVDSVTLLTSKLDATFVEELPRD